MRRNVRWGLIQIHLWLPCISCRIYTAWCPTRVVKHYTTLNLN